MGQAFPDGSFATYGFEISLKTPMTRAQVQDVVDQSGLVGLSYSDTKLSAYYVGKPGDKDAFRDFHVAALRAGELTRGNGGRNRRHVSRLWSFGRSIDGLAEAIPYASIAGEVHPVPAGASATARRVAERLAGREVAPAQQQDITPAQRALQERITEFYAMPSQTPPPSPGKMPQTPVSALFGPWENYDAMPPLRSDFDSLSVILFQCLTVKEAPSHRRRFSPLFE